MKLRQSYARRGRRERCEGGGRGGGGGDAQRASDDRLATSEVLDSSICRTMIILGLSPHLFYSCPASGRRVVMHDDDRVWRPVVPLHRNTFPVALSRWAVVRGSGLPETSLNHSSPALTNSPDPSDRPNHPWNLVRTTWASAKPSIQNPRHPPSSRARTSAQCILASRRRTSLLSNRRCAPFLA